MVVVGHAQMTLAPFPRQRVCNEEALAESEKRLPINTHAEICSGLTFEITGAARLHHAASGGLMGLI